MKDPAACADADDKKIRLEVKEIERAFQKVRTWEHLCDQYFLDHPMISIDYENLTQNAMVTFRYVCDFLGVSDVRPSANLVKQNPEPLSELVENYDELKAAFALTRWSYLFNRQ